MTTERPCRWSDEDTQLLISLCKAGITKAAAADKLGRTIQSVLNKGRQLNLSFLREDSWTDHEIGVLEQMAKAGKTVYDIAAELGRSSSAVECKARAFKITLVSTADAVSNLERSCDTWTCEDIRVLETSLEEHYSVDEIAPMLGRSPKAIRSKMHVLGLRMVAG